MKIQAVITKKPVLPTIHTNIRLPIREKRKPREKTQLGLVFAAGVSGLLIGVVLFFLRREQVCQWLETPFESYRLFLQTARFSQLFTVHILRDLLLQICCVLPGVSLAGFALLPCEFALILSGMSLFACFLVRQFALNGIGFFFLCLFPGKMIQMFALLIMIQSGIEKSKSLRQIARGESPLAEQTFQFYWQRTGMSTVLLFIASLFDCILIRLFMTLFFSSV